MKEGDGICLRLKRRGDIQSGSARTFLSGKEKKNGAVKSSTGKVRLLGAGGVLKVTGREMMVPKIRLGRNNSNEISGVMKGVGAGRGVEERASSSSLWRKIVVSGWKDGGWSISIIEGHKKRECCLY